MIRDKFVNLIRIKLHNLTAKYNVENNDKYYEICDIENTKVWEKGDKKKKKEKEKRERVRSSIKWKMRLIENH